MNELIGVLGVLGALVVLMLGVRALQRRAWVGPELGRKIVHAGMGLVCAAFPWIFSSVWPVVLLAVATMAGLFAVRRLPGICGLWGGVLGGVGRESLGEFYFIAAVAGAWLWTGGEPFLFTTPMLVLALADTAGALVGQRWGEHAFGPDGDRKTLEGSLAVGVVAFLSISGMTAWLRPAPWSTIVSTAGLVTMAAVWAEAIGTRGRDNLTLPVVTCLLLQRCGDYRPSELVWQFSGWAVLVAAVCCLGARRSVAPETKAGPVSRFFAAAVILWGAFNWPGSLLPAILP